jgi:hypothetical protein
MIVVLYCPDCWPGKLARHEVLADGFWRNLWLAALPFLIIAAVTWLLQKRTQP